MMCKKIKQIKYLNSISKHAQEKCAKLNIERGHNSFKPDPK